MKNLNYKLKLLYLQKILQDHTDENHGLTMAEILDHLAQYGIQAERKSVYDDIETLREFGMDIIGEKRRKNFHYALVNRDFELAEVKVLMDAVQAANFISEKKSNQLIEKLGTLVSNHNAVQLQQQVFVSGRSKTSNEEIYYNIDKLYKAINDNHQVRFAYCNWTVNKQLEEKHDGKEYVVSPWALIWDNENYYLLGYHHEYKALRTYRVDKMKKLEIRYRARLGNAKFAKIDLSKYAMQTFSMYHGDTMQVKLRFVNHMAGVVVDKFGADVNMVRADKEHFIAHITVDVSDKFLAWLVSMGDNVEVLSPEVVQEQLAQVGQKLLKKYGKFIEESVD